MNTKCRNAFPLIGRVLLSVIFIMSGIHKVFSWDQTSEQMANEGMVMISLFLVGAILCEIGGGMSILLGC